jgi:hypothetical protein
MRSLLFAAGALLFTALPAAAQPGPSFEERAAGAVAHRGIDMTANAVDRMVGAIMALPVGDLAAPFDPYGRTPYGPGTTLGDMTRRGDPDADARMHQDVRNAARMAHALTDSMVRAAPAVRQSVRQLEQSLIGIIAAASAGE